MLKQYQIFIAGYYGFRNTGDEAILSGMLRDLRAAIPDVNFVVVSGDPINTQESYGTQSVMWTDIPAIMEAIKDSDLVILGGGGLFQDYWHIDEGAILTSKHAGISFFVGFPLLAKFYDKPCMLYALGIGPLATEVGRRLTRMAFSLADRATVRDSESLDLLKSIDVPVGQKDELIKLTADPAFSMRKAPREEARAYMQDLGINLNDEVLGVCLRYWDIGVDPGYWEEQVAKALDLYLGENSSQIFFLPFQRREGYVFDDDWSVSHRVMKRMNRKDHCILIDQPLRPDLAATVLGECNLVLAMRMHAALFALNANVPVVTLSYDKKVQSLMRIVKAEMYSLSNSYWEANSIFDRMKEAISVSTMGLEDFQTRFREDAFENAKIASELIKENISEEVKDYSAIKDFALLKTRTVLDLQETLQKTERQLERLIAEHRLSLEEAEKKISEIHIELLNERKESAERIKTLEQEFMAKRVEAENEIKKMREEASKEINRLQEEIRVLHQVEKDRDRLAAELLEIHYSRYWRILSVYWRIRGFLKRVISNPRSIVHGIVRRIRPSRIKWWLKRLKFRGLSYDTHSTFRHGSCVIQSPIEGKYDVLVLPIIDWDFRFQRPQQLSREFARDGHRVFYMKTRFHKDDSVVLRSVGDRIYEYQLPGRENYNLYQDALGPTELEEIQASIDELVELAGICEAICLVQFPSWTPLINRLRTRYGWKIIYDCMDDHGSFTTNNLDIAGVEESLLQTCNLAIAASKNLLAKCSQRTSETLLIPNGVDFEHFSSARQHTTRPTDLPIENGTIIGYIGAISDWFDFDLLRTSINAHPEWTFVLIGSTWGADNYDDLQKMSNVHFLGEKPYDVLPQYLSHFDVCSIPFKITPLTIATNPVKIYEYLAAGKPVVASRLPELEKFQTWISLVDDPNGFLMALEKEIDWDTEKKQCERQNAVVRHTWNDRYKNLQRCLVSHFGKISIIIVTWNNLLLTKECLESLWRSTTHPNLEVILVDNASADGTPDFLNRLSEERENIHLVLNNNNLGFAAAVNQGLEAASGDFVVVLNNDIVLTNGWLSKLLSRLEDQPSIGLIGPVSNHVGNEAWVPAGYTHINGLDEFAVNYAKEHTGETAPIPMLAMFCVVGRRSLFEEVGPLDENYRVGMFEDDDLAIRIRKAGYRLACARDVYVHHHGRAGFNHLGEKRYQEIFATNQSYFEEKWKIKWRHHAYGDLQSSINLQKELRSILRKYQNAEEIVIIPPCSHMEYSEVEHLNRMAHELAQNEYLTFLCEEDGEEHGFEIKDQYLYLARVPAEIFDLIDSPIVFDIPNRRDFVYKLRSPKIIKLEADEVDLVIHRIKMRSE